MSEIAPVVAKVGEREALMHVDDLRVEIATAAGGLRAVDGVSFALRRGETFALLGESGCGKSITALALMRLLPEPAARVIHGTVDFDGRNLLELTEREMREVRGLRMAMIFQEPQTSLNPVMTVGRQIDEMLARRRIRPGLRRKQAIALLEAVGLADPGRRVDEYPHQMSGGMRQRAMIAIALAGEPDLLIADEPTTALDVTIQAQILELLREQQRRTGMGLLLITHDLGVVAQMADEVAVMYAGEIVETAPRAQFFAAPRHPYSKRLFEAIPDRSKRGGQLAMIPGSVPRMIGEAHWCRFNDRCDWAWSVCREVAPQWIASEDGGVRCHLYDPKVHHAPPEERVVGGEVNASPGRKDGGQALQVRDLKVYFPIRAGILQRTVGYVRAVDGVSLDIPPGRTVALVGESGSGKTTVGKAILRLLRPHAGRVEFGGQDLAQLRGRALRAMRSQLQIVFQDPYSSLNPRMTVGAILEEGLVAQGIARDRVQREARIDALLAQVGLFADAKHRYPHQFSGGQRQRIAIARALAVEPRLIVCDEPTSALDVSVQAQILNLLKSLQDGLGLSYLFITHNISVVEYLAHDVAIMYLGRIVEQGPVEEVLTNPRHPYTQTLLAAVPKIETRVEAAAPGIKGDVPSPSNPPAGCHFHPRCTRVMPVCRVSYPAPTQTAGGTRVACHLYSNK